MCSNEYIRNLRLTSLLQRSKEQVACVVRTGGLLKRVASFDCKIFSGAYPTSWEQNVRDVDFPSMVSTTQPPGWTPLRML